jgi:hypothetical protein
VPARLPQLAHVSAVLLYAFESVRGSGPVLEAPEIGNGEEISYLKQRSLDF